MKYERGATEWSSLSSTSAPYNNMKFNSYKQIEQHTERDGWDGRLTRFAWDAACVWNYRAVNIMKYRDWLLRMHDSCGFATRIRSSHAFSSGFHLLYFIPDTHATFKNIHPKREEKRKFQLTVILLAHCSFWFGESVVGDVGEDVDTFPDGIFSAVLFFTVVQQWWNSKNFIRIYFKSLEFFAGRAFTSKQKTKSLPFRASLSVSLHTIECIVCHWSLISVRSF